MKKKVSWFLLLLLPVILYAFIFREYVTLAYQHKAPSWFQQLIHSLYPRFEVEKHRFHVDFFLAKADQVILRYALVLLFLSLLSLWPQKGHFMQSLVKPYSYLHYRRLSLLFYSGLLLYTWDWVLDFPSLIALEPFYKPVLFYDVLDIQIPALAWLQAAYGLYIIAIGLVMMNYFPVIAASIAAFFLLLFQGYFLSFEKIDHGYSTLTYATLLMPFLLWEVQKERKQDANFFAIKSWSLFLIQCMIAAVYFLAGWEKVLTSGWHWASQSTFQTYLSLHPTPLSQFIVQQPVLSTLLPLLILLFQFGFIAIFFFPKHQVLFLLGGVLFHVGTKWVMDIGGWISPWIFVYIFFIRWEGKYFRTKLSNQGLQPLRDR